MNKDTAIKVTKIFCLITFLIIIIYDIIIAIIQPAGTISNVALMLSYKIAFIPFAVGFISGHVFWSGKNPTKNDTVSIIIGIIIGIILSFVNVKLQLQPIIYLILGILCGHIIWQQKKRNNTH